MYNCFEKHKGQLTIVKGRPGVGKTTLAIQEFVHESICGTKTLYISLEHTKEVIAKRINELFDSYDLKGISFDIYDSLPITLEELIEVIKTSNAELVYVDYVGLVNINSENKETEICRQLYLLASELNIMIVLLMSQTRDYEDIPTFETLIDGKFGIKKLIKEIGNSDSIKIMYVDGFTEREELNDRRGEIYLYLDGKLVKWRKETDVPFDKNAFIKLIKKKAKEKNLIKEVEEELFLFEKYNQIEYLFLVSQFIKKLKEVDIPYISLRMAGATSVIAYLLDICKINPVNHNLSNKFFFDYEFKDGGVGPRFDICVPKSKKEEAVRILNGLSHINEETSDASIFRFGKNDKYRIGLYGHSYLDRLVDAIKLMIDYDLKRWCTKDFDSIQDTDDNYEDVLKFMLEEDKKTFCLPNLNGCVMGIPSEFYELMEAGKPKSLSDLAKINCLTYGVFKNRNKLIKSLEENGLDGTICSREQFFDLLVSQYDIDESTAFQITEDVIERHELTEWEELTLESHEVPDYILKQLENIKYLHYMSASLQEMQVAYYLAELKMWLPGEFEDLIPVPYKHSFVGPFFYINKRLYSYTDSMTNFNGNVRFFDTPMSHFEYFDTLGIDGDYGNYPRGRVIFDNFHKKFIVYLDKDLLTDDIKMSIMLTYCLEEGQTVFRRDSHYTHDGL